MTPASAPRCRTANASTGRRQRARQHAARAGRRRRRPRRCRGRTRRTCAGRRSRRRPRPPPCAAARYAARPAAARGHDDAVHPVRARRRARPRRPGGAELQRAAEPVGEVGRVARPAVACGSARASGSELGPRRPGRAVVARSSAGARARRVVVLIGRRRSQPAGRRRPAASPIRLAAVAAGLEHLLVVRAARRSCRRRGWSPATCRAPPGPASRAAIASSAVDMPTRSAPMRADHADLGRRLVVRAGELHVDALVQVGSTSRHSARSRGE